MPSKQIIPVGAYAANCIVLWEGTQCLVVDPGQDAADIDAAAARAWETAAADVGWIGTLCVRTVSPSS